MVADSRQVALNHTAGLSLPQQMQMGLFAAFALLDKENKYKQKMQEIIRRRLHALWENTGFTLTEDPLRVGIIQKSTCWFGQRSSMGTTL